MVGDEFIEMWQWITTIDEIPVTPGLLDVPTWIDRLGQEAERYLALL